MCLVYKIPNEVAYVAQRYPPEIDQALRVGWTLLRQIDGPP